MQIREATAVSSSSSPNTGFQPVPAAATPADRFERTPFRRGADGVQLLPRFSQAFVEGLERVQDAAGCQPTTADLDEAKKGTLFYHSRNHKAADNRATLGLTHNLRKTRRSWQDGRYGGVAAGVGMMALAMVGLTAVGATILGGPVLICDNGFTVHFKKRSLAGTLKFIVSKELYRLGDELYALSRNMDDSFITGEVSPAQCLEVLQAMRARLAGLREQLAQHPEPRVARSRRLPRQFDAIDAMLAKVERKAQRRLR